MKHAKQSMRLAAMTAGLLTWAAAILPAAAAELAQRGEVCGTVAKVQCAEGLWCDPKPGTCGDENAFGKCVRETKICTREYIPVCGCNERTYSNNCGRRAAKVGLNYKGKCLKDEFK